MFNVDFQEVPRFAENIVPIMTRQLKVAYLYPYPHTENDFPYRDLPYRPGIALTAAIHFFPADCAKRVPVNTALLYKPETAGYAF